MKRSISQRITSVSPILWRGRQHNGFPTLYSRSLLSPLAMERVSPPCAIVSVRSFNSSQQTQHPGEGFQQAELSVATHSVTDVEWDGGNDRDGFTNKELDLEKWKKVSQDIVDTPMGELSVSNGKLARHAIYWWSRNRTPTAIQEAFRLIERIAMELELNEELRYDWYHGNSPVGLRLLNAVMDAYTSCWIQQNQGTRREQQQQQQQREKVHTPSDLLTVLQGLETLGYPTDCRSYSLLMKAAVRARGPSCTPPPVFCEQVIHHMLDRVSSTNDSACAPDIIAFTTALKAWTLSFRDDAAERAKLLWRQVIQLCDDRVVDAQPNTVFYNTMLEALVNAKRRQGDNWEFTELAEEIFRNMWASPYPNVAPTDVSIRLVVFGWINLAQRLSTQSRITTPRTPEEALLRGYQLLRDVSQMPSLTELVDSTIASSLLWTAVETGSTDALAERIFTEMYDTSSPLFEPNCSSFRAMIILYSKTGQPERAQQMVDALESLAKSSESTDELPDASIYRECIWAWMKKGGPESVVRAEKLLTRLFELTEETGDKVFAPDRKTVSLVLEALGRSRDYNSAQRALALLQMLLRTYERTNWTMVAPRASFYLYVLQALSRSKESGAAAKAETLLSELEDMYMNRPEPNMIPTSFHYHAVLEALGNSPKPSSLDRARSIFQRARRVFDQSRDERTRPDEAMYGSYTNVCAKVGDAEAALFVFQDMIREFQAGNSRAKPSARVLRNVLFACFRTDDPRAVDLAHSAIATLENSGCGLPDKNCQRILQEIESSKRGRRVTPTGNSRLASRR